MKRLITYLLVLLSETLLVGCPVMEYNISRSFIGHYYEIDDIKIFATYQNIIAIYGIKEGELWEIINSYSQEDKYNALCKKHNDMNWNKMEYSQCVLGVDFLSIDVVSDADFDESHPAGTSLADLLRFESETLYPFVSGGYKGAEFGENYNRGHISYIKKPLSEMTIDDMKILGFDGGISRFAEFRPSSTDIFSLYWLSEPTLSQTHNITITMISDDGRTFEKTIEVSWE